MTLYVIRRLLMIIPVLLGVSFLTFVISYTAPGDPVTLMLGDYATADRVAELRQQLGLDDPFLIQYLRYVWAASHGDLGKSIRGQTPVIDEIMARFPSTLQLTVTAMLMAIVGGVTAGVIAATNRGRVWEGAMMVTALLGLSIPEFWLAIILIMVFGVHLGWVSVTGGEGYRDLILPSICLAFGAGAVLARHVRSGILEVMAEDYVRTARAKGLRETIVTFRHVLRNALIPVVTVIGLMFGQMLGSSVFVESIFARPGLGRFAVDAIAHRDYAQVRGMVLLTATAYVLLNLAVDLLYGFLDPRLRYGGRGK